MQTQYNPDLIRVPLKAPFPYFGGKSTVASYVWQRFGDTPNYVEPFAGSLAVLLGRPHAPNYETVNDLDCYIANFWRALQSDPDTVAHYADWPVNEADLHARHYWLVTEGRERLERVIAHPDGYDAQVAGWWVWGISAWIGAGWCSGRGGWRVGVDGWERVDGGRGVDRPLAHLASRRGVHRKLPHMSGAQGVHRKRPHMSGAHGVHRKECSSGLIPYMRALADRLRRVRVACGDWSRVLGPAVTTKLGITAVFLDPPYADGRAEVYRLDSTTVYRKVVQWCIENGDNPKLRIALCGYEGDYDMPDTWDKWAWKAKGGYAGTAKHTERGRENARRERIWFSPHCLPDVSAACRIRA